MFRNRFRSFAIILLTLFLAVLVGLASAPIAAAAGPTAQTAPIEGSIFPALLQIALIVLVTEGIKSLAKALGGTDEDGNPKIDLHGREAALAYIAVGVLVYVVQSFLLPALSPDVADKLASLLAVVATLLAGSGLFSMTSAFRVRGN